MKATAAAALAILILPHASQASQFAYNFTEVGLYSGELGNFTAADAGDKYSVSGLRAAHVQKYSQWIAELSGNYGKNALDINGDDQAFTELGVEASVGRHLRLGEKLELAAFVGGNYLSLETLEFTSSDTYVLGRARASYPITKTIEVDLDYEIQSGGLVDQHISTFTGTWDNHRNLSVAIQQKLYSDSDNGDSETLFRGAYQTAPDLKIYLQYQSASYNTGDTSVFELGIRVLLGQSDVPATNTGQANTPHEDTGKRRRSADDVLRRDLPPPPATQ